MSKTIKSISCQNFAGIKEVNVSFDENVTYLIGNNGSNKSTIGLTIPWFVIQGIAQKKSKNEEPINGNKAYFIGENSKSAEGSVTFYDDKLKAEIKVTRIISARKNELKFEAPKDVVIGQEWLNELFNLYLIAPKRFASLSPKEQALVLGIDTDEFDQGLKVEKEKQKDANAKYNEAKAKLQNLALSISEFEIEKYKEEKDPSEISARYNKALEQSNKAKSAEELIDKLQSENEKNKQNIKDLENKIKAIKDLIKENNTKTLQCREFIDNYTESLEQNPDIYSTDAILAELTDVNNYNKKVGLASNIKQLEKDVTEKLSIVEKHKKGCIRWVNSRNDYLTNINLEFKNLIVNENGELLLKKDGETEHRPISEPYFSTGELIKIIPVLISSVVNPEFKYIFIQDFNLLDEENQKNIIEYLTGQGFQLVIEYVSSKTIGMPNEILLTENKN